MLTLTEKRGSLEECEKAQGYGTEVGEGSSLLKLYEDYNKQTKKLSDKETYCNTYRNNDIKA